MNVYVVIVVAGDELRVAADGRRLQVFALPDSALALAIALEHAHGVPALPLERSAAEIADLLHLHGVEPEDVDLCLDVVEAQTTDERDCTQWIAQLAARVARSLR